jgi:hypothetical protein
MAIKFRKIVVFPGRYESHYPISKSVVSFVDEAEGHDIFT